jgi:hypothetical protein
MTMLSYHLKIDRCYIDERAITILYENEFENTQIFQHTISPFPEQYI